MMIDRIVALLDGLDATELDKLPPARQRRFAELCFYWHRIAERRLERPARSGILWDLSNNRHSE